jgi:hypothetical protein
MKNSMSANLYLATPKLQANLDRRDCQIGLQDYLKITPAIGGRRLEQIQATRNLCPSFE